MKNSLIVLLVVIVLALGGYLLFRGSTSSVDQGVQDDDVATTTDEIIGDQANSRETVIGQSVEGRDITAYHYGEGGTELLFIGGIHGGYSWNTTLVSYSLMDYLKSNPDSVPENIKVTVIPTLNPDGLYGVVGTTTDFSPSDISASEDKQIEGRFNANGVDLNRNFDCDWEKSGVWQGKTVSGGTESFSEPESKAIQSYIESHNLSAVVVWYSAAGGVFASSCHNGVSTETSTLTNLYADASGYRAYEEFDFYDITGDIVNWLAKENIPAISVLLSTHKDVEWDKNQKGVEALLTHYGE